MDDNTRTPITQDIGHSHQSVYHQGHEGLIALTWPAEDWEATRVRWGYERFFELGGEDMGAEDEEGEAGAWQADVTVVAYLSGSARAPYPYVIGLFTPCEIRWVYFPLISDLFAFCNLAAPTLRLNYETRPRVLRGAAEMRRLEWQERLRARR